LKQTALQISRLRREKIQSEVESAKSGYGKIAGKTPRLGLRAIELAYLDPFTHKRVTIRAPIEAFLREHGFDNILENGRNKDGQRPSR